MNLFKDIQIQNQTGYKKVPANRQWLRSKNRTEPGMMKELEKNAKLLRGPAGENRLQFSLSNYLHLEKTPVVDC